MWIPKTENEVVSAVKSKSIEETSIFEVKQDLSQKNQEIAKDIASMANEGGVIIYGIGEDENGRPAKVNPIPLAGLPEKIAAIVSTSISEPLRIIISTIPTIENPSIGYLVVYIPQSERAPHMVIVKGDNRYYGRAARGNIPLSEAEVSRLYERRRKWEVDRETLLDEEIKISPIIPIDGLAFLYLFTKPVSANDRLLEGLSNDGNNIQTVINNHLAHVASPDVYPRNYSPDFGTPTAWNRRPEGWLLHMDSHGLENPRSSLNLQVDFNGRGHLFCGRAAEKFPSNFAFIDELVAGVTCRFLLLMGEIYDSYQYIGSTDIGVAIIGIKGSSLSSPSRFYPGEFPPYDRNEYRKTDRVSAMELKNNYREIAIKLLKPIFDAFSQGRVNPFHYFKDKK